VVVLILMRVLLVVLALQVKEIMVAHRDHFIQALVVVVDLLR
jgi:hypothetical protein